MMRKFLVLLVFLVGCAVQPASEVSMPTNNEIVDIFKRRMPDLTPQEAQDIQDYLSQVDSAVSHFGGGDSLNVDALNANTGSFERPPIESGRWIGLSQSIASGAWRDVTWWSEGEDYNTGVVAWDSSDPTKFYVQQRGEGQSFWITCFMFAGTLQTMGLRVNFYDKDGGDLGGSVLFTTVEDEGHTGTIATTLTPDLSYFVVQALTASTNNYSFRLGIIGVY